VTPTEPFRQLRFEDVPELPRKPHAYAQARTETLALESRDLGPLRIHVRSHGSGPPLLLVHGFMTSSYSWRYALEPLGRHFTCYAPDLPGAGRSSAPLGPYAPDALARAVGEIQRALGLRGAPVIGNSLGGYLCMRLALEDPASMSRLVNVHSPGLATFRNRALSTALGLVPRAGSVVDALVARDPERWVHRNVHYFDESLKSREEHREYAAPLRTPEGRRAFFRMLDETFDVRQMRAFEARLQGLGGAFPVPLLLLYAARDPMVPPEVGDRLHALLPSARFERVEGGSHFMHVDATEAFVARVLPFLRE
jgi:pimeloyl-ACP methyl ester carboxylesterase